jgi:hypothetical protein
MFLQVVSSMFPKYKNFPSKISLGHAFGLTSKLVASKWRNSPPPKKDFWVKFDDSFMKKKAGANVLPIFGSVK